MEAIIDYLKKINSPILEKALQAIECFEPFNRKPEMYGISAAFHGQDCMNEIIELLHTIQKNKILKENESESALNVNINSIVVANGEYYYHTMMTDDNESWNIRDRHMVEALEYIHNFYGPLSKDIVWEHNTHVGDARATDMASEGMVNVGQLVREKYGENQVFIIGFGSNQGTVIAANRWGSPAEVMNVPQGEKGSWEDLLHSAKPNIHYLLFTEENKSLFNTEIWHRAIGVVYNPEYEHLGNYVPSLISKRYNAFVYVDVTQALTLLKL